MIIHNDILVYQFSNLARQMEPINIKVMLVGDAKVGKTSLLQKYRTGKLPQTYVPTTIDNYEATFKQEGHIVNLSVWDTAGNKENLFLRYFSADVFLICFSLSNPVTFKNAIQKWFRHLNENFPKALKIFVGTRKKLQCQQQGRNSVNTGKFDMSKSAKNPQLIAKSIIQAHGCKLLTFNALTNQYEQSSENIIKQAIIPFLPQNRTQKDQGSRRKSASCLNWTSFIFPFTNF